MSPFQIAAWFFVAAFPLAGLWCRRCQRGEMFRFVERVMAVALVLSYLGDVGFKIHDGNFNAAYVLPMQLCDWALVAVIIALWRRSQAAFDLAYFWGLAGTLQALFTPAIASDIFWMRQLGFFFIHAGIVAGVLHLLVNDGFRPRWPKSIVRIVIASEIYLATVLVVNALTGGNYGFLSHKPTNRSLLDLFSDEHWLYAVQLNLTAFVFFAILYAPWGWVDWRQRHSPQELANRR